MPTFTYDVFISYSHRDADWVRSWLLPHLEAASLRACIDFRDFEVGTPSIVNMENAAKNSRKTLLVMTPNWTASEWTDFESILTQTRDPAGRRRSLVPVMLEACDLPDRLAIFTHADFTDPARWSTELIRVIDAIRDAPTTAPSHHAPATLPPNLVHPYPLQANFTGRLDERRELTAWLADDTRPICALVAMGGMGKSALAWYWLTHDVLPHAQTADTSTLDGVMWWSFYEGESSFAKFIDAALTYVGGQPIDATLFPTAYDRAQELRRLLQTKRVFFVLDGFERQLRAYARMDAAYQLDDAADLSLDARTSVDPIAARWLAAIAADTRGPKLLLTTRLMPRELEDHAGDPLAGVLNRELTELPRDDAVRFMQAQGVSKGTPAEIATACAAYGNHPLSLRLLSGLIARDKRMPGDITAAPRVATRDDFVAAQRHILEQSYNALPKKERALLSRIAAFRSPMAYDALLIFNKLGNEERFEAALDDLQKRGLLQRDLAQNRYDLHPIVRRYAYDRLTDKTGVHIRLRDYFASIAVPDTHKIQSIQDLAPVIELYHHTIRAGQYDEAHALLSTRLVPKPLHFRFGAYQLIIELTRAFFPDGEDRAPRLKDKGAQAWALSALGTSYDFSGQPRRAVPLYKQHNAIRESQGSKKNVVVGLANLAGQQIRLGEIEAAILNLRRAIELNREVGDGNAQSVILKDLGLSLAYRGEYEESLEYLDEASKIEEVISHFQALCINWSYRTLRLLLMGDARAALKAVRRAFEFWKKDAEEDYPVERDLVRVEWLLGMALTIEGKELDAAATHLTDSLTRCRRINLVEIESDILLAWARWHQASGNTQEMGAYAGEALAIADRCGYRLAQAEINNFLARLALDAGNKEVARKHAETARERAWCDGPPHCYKVALDEAEGMLKELGAS